MVEGGTPQDRATGGGAPEHGMVDHGVVWFRKDLRLVDNPAWNAAVSKCRRITALFVVDPAIVEPAGPYRLAQLSAHLRALDEELASAGGQLWLRRGDPASVVPHVVGEVEAGALYANADAAPGSRRRDKRVHQALASTPAARHHRNEPVPFHTYWGTLVLPPLSVTTNDGGVSKVFTPFYKRWRDTPWDAWPERNPLAEDTPQVTRPPSQAAWGAGETMAIDNLHHAGDVPHHSGGSQAALGRLGAAVQRAPRYRDERDRPDLATTTELSADLHYGTLSPRRAASALGHATGGSDSEGPPADAVEGGAAIVRQLAWRDWYAHLLWAHPHLTDRAMRSEYDRLPWQNDPDEFDAWCQGRTGFPIVDAGMRQLAASGWMHNRVRMIVASFLVKDLLVDWRLGEAHFRRLLVDGDTTQNVGNWQWVAGTGPDAAPYFRVFNPTTQAEKFDPRGEFVRSWVPELAGLPPKWIHRPSEAPAGVLADAGVELGTTYPLPLIDHGDARERALAAYGQARGDTPSK